MAENVLYGYEPDPRQMALEAMKQKAQKAQSLAVPIPQAMAPSMAPGPGEQASQQARIQQMREALQGPQEAVGQGDMIPQPLQGPNRAHYDRMIQSIMQTSEGLGFLPINRGRYVEVAPGQFIDTADQEQMQKYLEQGWSLKGQNVSPDVGYRK